MRSTWTGVVLAWLSFVSPASALARAQDLAAPRRVARLEVAPGDGQRALLAHDGRRLGSWRLTADAAHVTLDGRELVLPRLQEWLVSSDGRTLVGVGDARAPEHPFELTVQLWRDGFLATELAERFDPESELTVGADGTLALVGQRAGERGQPLALVVAPDGVLTRTVLPPGTTVHDPVLVADGLLLRSAPLPGHETVAAILRVDALGVHTLVQAPALSLVALPGRDEVLVHERAALSLVDARAGTVRWRFEVPLRPASERAWHLWPSTRGPVLALVTAGLKRRGTTEEPRARLELFELASGAALASVALEPGGPPGHTRLWSEGETLLVEGQELREVFAW